MKYLTLKMVNIRYTKCSYFEILQMNPPQVCKFMQNYLQHLKFLILNSSQIVLTTSIFDKERKGESFEFIGASKLILFHNLFLTPILPAF